MSQQPGQPFNKPTASSEWNQKLLKAFHGWSETDFNKARKVVQNCIKELYPDGKKPNFHVDEGLEKIVQRFQVTGEGQRLIDRSKFPGPPPSDYTNLLVTAQKELVKLVKKAMFRSNDSPSNDKRAREESWSTSSSDSDEDSDDGSPRYAKRPKTQDGAPPDVSKYWEEDQKSSKISPNQALGPRGKSILVTNEVTKRTHAFLKSEFKPIMDEHGHRGRGVSFQLLQDKCWDKLLYDPAKHVFFFGIMMELSEPFLKWHIVSDQESFEYAVEMMSASQSLLLRFNHRSAVQIVVGRNDLHFCRFTAPMGPIESYGFTKDTDEGEMSGVVDHYYDSH